jgi:hypothetical protein
MSESDDRLVYLRGGLVLPAAAVIATLHLEAAGHQLRLDGDDAVIERAKGIDIDAADLAMLKRWKPWVKLLITYNAETHGTEVRV